jgi:hypothetical protein
MEKRDGRQGVTLTIRLGMRPMASSHMTHEPTVCWKRGATTMNPRQAHGPQERLTAVTTVLSAFVFFTALTGARAQAPPLTPAPPADVPVAKEKNAPKVDAKPPAGAVETLYRFSERYTTPTDAGKAKPTDLGQYRVAARGVASFVTEKAQGTPTRAETVVQVIYSERPAQVNASSIVTDVVRRYEALRISPMPPDSRPDAPKLLVGLSLWYKARPKMPPRILSLTPNRALMEGDFSITRQLVFFPDLSLMLPPDPQGIGDQWPISPIAAATLMGDTITSGDALIATLTDVKPSADGTKQTALIDVVGQALVGPMGIDNALKARVTFTFATADAKPEPAATTPGGKPTETVVSAPGAITSVRLTRASQLAVPGPNNRLKKTVTQELVIERQTTPDEKASPPIAVPSPPPVFSTDNSWLVYEDPHGRFNFRHPQDLLLQFASQDDKEPEIQLAEMRPGSGEGRALHLVLQSKSGNPVEDKAKIDPEAHMRDLKAEWTETRQTVKMGDIGWLPEASWAPTKMKVYRVEAALTSKNSAKVFQDHYLVLFTQNESLVVDTYTGQNSPAAFRLEVEEILKTFRLGRYAAGK